MWKIPLDLLMPWTFLLCISSGSIHLDWHLIKKTNDNNSAIENGSENDNDFVSIHCLCDQTEKGH